MARSNAEPVHYSIKEKLGYPEDISDEEFWADWKDRTSKVCKPCWELKYCPYGKLVELSPLLPGCREDAVEHNERLRESIESGVGGMKEELDDEALEELEAVIADMGHNPIEYALHFANKLRVQEMIQEAVDREEDDPISAIAGPEPPIQFYRSAFPIESSKDRKERMEEKYTPEVKDAISQRIAQMKEWLVTGVRDETRPLEAWRKRMFEKMVAEFDADQCPLTQPQRIYETKCNIFGHVCPVFFAANAVTETTEERRRGRYISFETKMRVVRRDNYTCQHCGKHLVDTEVEFDHVIPVSKGGSSEEPNIRLTCFDCNRSKSDDVEL